MDTTSLNFALQTCSFPVYRSVVVTYRVLIQSIGKPADYWHIDFTNFCCFEYVRKDIIQKFAGKSNVTSH
jgi:hypothetical protein